MQDRKSSRIQENSCVYLYLTNLYSHKCPSRWTELARKWVTWRIRPIRFNFVCLPAAGKFQLQQLDHCLHFPWVTCEFDQSDSILFVCQRRENFSSSNSIIVYVSHEFYIEFSAAHRYPWCNAQSKFALSRSPSRLGQTQFDACTYCFPASVRTLPGLYSTINKLSWQLFPWKQLTTRKMLTVQQPIQRSYDRSLYYKPLMNGFVELSLNGPFCKL